MGMSDPHRNCFFYYRGQIRGRTGDESEALREQQVEDNTTKALLNVLEHADDRLTVSFVKRFLGAELISDDPGGALEPFAYFLQGGPRVTAPSRWLVGISQLGEMPPAEANGDEPGSGGSRVDAGFSRAGDLVVVF